MADPTLINSQACHRPFHSLRACQFHILASAHILTAAQHHHEARRGRRAAVPARCRLGAAFRFQRNLQLSARRSRAASSNQLHRRAAVFRANELRLKWVCAPRVFAHRRLIRCHAAVHTPAEPSAMSHSGFVFNFKTAKVRVVSRNAFFHYNRLPVPPTADARGNCAMCMKGTLRQQGALPTAWAYLARSRGQSGISTAWDI